MTECSHGRGSEFGLWSICLALLLVLWIWMSTLLLSHPTEQLPAYFPDDAFYYLVPSWYIANGEGPTGDGVTLTSGYHPLWMMFLSGWCQLTGSGLPELLRWSVWWATGFFFVGAGLLLILLRQWLPWRWAVMWWLVYLTKPIGSMTALSLTESGLLSLSLVAIGWGYQNYLKNPGWIRSAMLGLLSGLALLTRTDTILLLALMVVLEFWRVWRTRGQSTPLPIASWGISLGVFILVLSPWLILAWQWYGTPLQQSALVKFYWRKVHLANSGLKSRIGFSLSQFLTWLEMLTESIPGFKVLSIVSLLSGGLIWFGFPIKLELKVWSKTNRLPILLLVLQLGYVLLIGGFYSLRFHIFKPWYLTGAALIGPLWGATVTHFWLTNTPNTILTRRQKAWIEAAVMVILIITLFSPVTIRWWQRGPSPDPTYLKTLAMAEWINNNLPVSARIGAYSSGKLQFACHPTVSNLDGLCNNDILEVAQSRQMATYLHQQQITYLADFESITGPDGNLARDSGSGYSRLHLSELHRIPTHSRYGDLVCWKLLVNPHNSERRSTLSPKGNN